MNYRSDPEATRRRLAEAMARLAADPDNQDLADQVRRLQHVLACLDWWEAMEHLAHRCRLILQAASRRN